MSKCTTAEASRPATMTEVVLPGIVEPDGLVVSERPIPEPGPGQARVRILATGVSFAENSMRRDRYPGQPKFPFVPGYDWVGEVEAVGRDADAVLVGRRVAAVTKTGGWASHTVIDVRKLIPVPEDLDPAVVETVLLNGITAWQMLERSARGLNDAATILVHGASGGVGGLLVQLARRRGMRVIGTASPRHHARLQALGVEVLDYRDPDLAHRLQESAPDGFDAVYDNIGGASFARSFRQLGPGGTLVGYGTASQREDADNQVLTFIGIFGRFLAWSAAPNRGRRARFYNFWAGSAIGPDRFSARLREDLGAILDRVGEGAVVAEVGPRFPLARASEAMALAETGRAGAKVIIEP